MKANEMLSQIVGEPISEHRMNCFLDELGWYDGWRRFKEGVVRDGYAKHGYDIDKFGFIHYHDKLTTRGVYYIAIRWMDDKVKVLPE